MPDLDPDAIEESLAENASGPKRVTSDEGTVEAHSLADQIAAAKYARAKAASSAAPFGLRVAQIVPPGAT